MIHALPDELAACPGLVLIVRVMFLVTFVVSKMARNAFRAIRSELPESMVFCRESLAGHGGDPAFSAGKDPAPRFAAINQTYYEKPCSRSNVFGIFVPLHRGALRPRDRHHYLLRGWRSGTQMTIGVLVAFPVYMRLFFQPLRELSQKYSIVQSAMASAERIFQLLDTGRTPGFAEVRNCLSLPWKEKSSFRYYLRV